jgi:amino acid adenylation domain-containing protein
MEPQQISKATDSEFLELLRERDIVLSMHGGKLRISAPAGTMDEGIKSELVRRKAMLLSHLQHESKNGAAKGIKRAPLSYAQERLWTLERFHPGNFAYNIPEISEVEAYIDPELMQKAIDYAVQRHETIRTCIREDEQRVPWQCVLPNVEARLQFHDFTHLDAVTKEAQLQSAVRELAHQPFDLRSAPLVRFHLFRMEHQRHIVFINIHHIVSDRWSMRILYRELLDAYQAFAEGGQPKLPLLPIQYAEYAARERSNTGPGIEDQLNYWRRKLENPPEPPRLPFVRQGSRDNALEGANYLIQFSAEDTAAIRALARKHGASAYMVLLAAYFALFHRFTGATDLCIGGPVSERTRTDTESLIGLFVNTLVLRCSVDPGESFSTLLKDVRETVLDAQANHEAPLQRILAEVSQTPGTAGHSLFETMLVFDPFVGNFTGQTTTGVALDPGLAKFDLLLQLNEEREQITGWFEYRTDLFVQDDIAKLAASFLLLVRSAVQEPERAVGKLEVVPPAEKDQFRLWNQTAGEFPRDKGIHDLFEEQVERSPQAIAAFHGITRITYEELNRTANRIAHGLLAMNLAPGSIVGIHLERSLTMIGAMLGILKAGCAYLPLDPSYPEERLRYMMMDSGCSCVLSETWQSENVRVCSPTFIHLEEAAAQHNPRVSVSPEDLAYVIYTSGSTGKPKGIAIEHRNTVSFLHAAKGSYPAGLLRGTLAATSISFDLSIFEIFVPLTKGGAIILAQDAMELASMPAAAEVTLASTVPSALSALLDAKCIPPTLRTINLIGELLVPALVDRIYAETGITAVNDLYGPTETTTYSTWTIRRRGSPATIGKPIENTRVYVVDGLLELVPIGIPGELLIAGAGVARGYLGRPELTAEKFISPSHLGEPGRAYRTGDLCSWNADGTLTYHGRIDSQVKVRGYRIELGEIEAALLSFPGVLEAVATTTTDADGGLTLIAAVRIDEKASLDIPALIDHQALVLPSFMLVRQIFVLDELPRTSNGKTDRARIASLFVPETSGRLIEPPNDPLERELVAIWEQSFGRSPLGMDDDFFQLGGQSLLALRIFSDIERRLGCKLMLSVLFEAPTIRALAERIRHTQTG